MSLENYLDSGHQLAVPLVAPTSGDGGFMETLNSCMSLQKDGLSSAAVVTHLDLSFENFSNSLARMAQMNANLVSGDLNSRVLDNITSSGLSIGPSSVFTDANLPLPVVAHLQRSGNANMDSYIDLYSSRLSFNLNPSAVDGSSVAQQQVSSYIDQNCRQGRKRMQQLEASSTATTQNRRGSLPIGINQEPGALTQMRKKQRLDISKEDLLHQQIVQQLLQRQDHVQMQYHNPQLQELIQQHRLQSQQKQKQQILQSVPQLRGVHSQQQQEMRQHLQQQVPHQVSAVHPLDGGVCSRRLMQYMYHLRHRPPDNNITYWRKFVAEYYAPGAKKRWCLSMYDDIGQHALGVFSQEAWHCDICGSKSGKGFEAIYEILPRLSKMKYESGVIDELLFLDLPHERRFQSGLMMLEYGKAVQESVYEQFRVVREGQLRVIFSHDLKILSWEFCARHHEELLPRRLVAPQVNQLVQSANKCQSTINDNASDRLSQQDLQLKCNMFLTAGRQLARNLELILVNDLGFAKRYLRCLQIAEVVSSMKDLMTFSHENNVGPIESLKNYFREDTKTKTQMKWVEQTEQQGSAQGLRTERNKLMMPPDPTSNINDNSHMTDGGILEDSGTASLALTNYYYQTLLRQSSASHNVGTVKQEPPSMRCSNQKASSPALGSQSPSTGLFSSSPDNGLSISQSSHSNKILQQHMIHKLLQEMVTNTRANGRVKEQVPVEFNGSTSDGLTRRSRGTIMVANGPGCGNTKSTGGVTGNTKSTGAVTGNVTGNSKSAGAVTADVLGSVPGRTNNVNSASNSSSSRVCGSGTLIKREPDLPEEFKMADDFTEIGDLTGDWKGMGYDWKA
ncbi:probable transcriptional regulator SLK3 isoform X2 [Cornus florida]|uniref:probable transcriptional regulator SLK3 isoform X2 n=1 Tax=Cornus florida TaxID=4283 RepID=UPI00289B5AD6|nr:probable transcriptional regulator SLK3 isoform X2 [Cornus florida]